MNKEHNLNEPKNQQLNIAGVINRFSDDDLRNIGFEQVKITDENFGDWASGKREEFIDGLKYYRDVILNGL